MKFNPRERVMLYILAVLVILAVGYFLMIKPQLDKIDMLNLDKISLEAEIQSLDSEIASSAKVIIDITDMKIMIEEMTKPFYPNILKDKLITTLENLILKSGVESNSLNFGATTVKVVDMIEAGTTESITFKIKEYADRYNALVQPGNTDTGTDTVADNTSTIPADERKLESIVIKLQIKGSYEQIINLFSEIESLNRTITISNIAMITGVVDETTGIESTEANVELIFYAIPKIFEQDAEYYAWP
jgi:type IV pilus assembly protein PilO